MCPRRSPGRVDLAAVSRTFASLPPEQEFLSGGGALARSAALSLTMRNVQPPADWLGTPSDRPSLAAVGAWLAYAVTVPVALGLLEKRREVVLRAVTRE